MIVTVVLRQVIAKSVIEVCVLREHSGHITILVRHFCLMSRPEPSKGMKESWMRDVDAGSENYIRQLNLFMVHTTSAYLPS